MFFRKKENILNKKWMKNNNFEFQRQILHQEITYKACNNKLILSQIDSNSNKIVLNLGSGYGIWSYKICKEYDIDCIINIDINFFDIYENINENIDYIENYYDLNIIFENTDLKKGIIKFRNNTIDFIYQRDMISVYNRIEWENILKEIYRVLKNKGYVEIVEYNFMIKHKKNPKLIYNKCSEIINLYLKNIFNINNYIYEPILIKHMLNLYFKNVDVKIIELPLYSEKKFEGHCVELLIKSYKHMKEEIEKIIPYTFDIFIDKLKKEWINNESYIELYIIYSQK